MYYSGVGESYGADFHSNNLTGDYESSLISKYLDGTEATNIYLSYMVKPVYYLDTQTTPDTVFVEVYDGNTWTTINKSYFRLSMDWKAEIFDLTDVATGNYFKIRFRITGANNSISTKYVYFDDVTVSTTLPEGTAIPHSVISHVNEKNVELAWQSPDRELYALTYANTSKQYSIGDAGVNFIAVNYFEAEDLVMYEDLYLTSITAYINQKVSSPSVETKIKLAVFDDDSRIIDQNIASFTANAWNTFILDQPILLNNKNLKFGIEVVTHDVSEEPIGVDGNRNPIKGKGDLYSEDDGLTWKTLSDAGKVNNWCIIGNVSVEDYEGEWNENILGYNIYKDGIRLNEDLIFAQSFIDDNYEGSACYTIRAYYLNDGISEESDEICIISHKISASSTKGGDIDPNGDIIVMEGDDQTFTFTSSTGYELAEVLVNDQNIPEAVSSKSYTFENVTEAHNIRAIFERIADKYIIEVSSTSGGSIDPNETVLVNSGDNQTFTFIPDTDYELKQVLIDDQDVTEMVVNSKYTFTNVTQDHTIHAVFERKNGVGIDNEEIRQLIIYPNPTTGQLYIDNSKSHITTLQVLDNNGRVIYEKNNISNGKITIDLSNYASGTYFIKTDEQISKIIKQ